MLNGKFYTGLPPKMIDRQSSGPNRQQSHFFWPDDTHEKQQTVPSRARQLSSNICIPNNKREQPQTVEPTKLFMKEFNKSKIHFNDVPDKGTLPQAKPISGGNKSQIQFFDYVGEEMGNMNNRQHHRHHQTSVVVSVEERNLKSEVEKNLKNSPKLQDKKFDTIITNDVKSQHHHMKKILKPTNNAKLRGDVMGGSSKSNRRIHYKDEVDDRYDYDNEDSTQFYPKSPLPRHKFRSRLDESSSSTEEKSLVTKSPVEFPAIPPPTQNHTPQRTTSSSHKHLVSNISFESSSNSNNETTIIPVRRNVRSSAVMRVSVGLPEAN